MRRALVLVALLGCRNVLGIPSETHVETFPVEVKVTGARGATDNPLQVFLSDDDSGERQTLTITQDGTFPFPRGLGDGAGFDVTASANCGVAGGSGVIQTQSALIQVDCDGLLGLADFGFSAPFEITGAAPSFQAHGSLLTTKTTLEPVPAYAMGSTAAAYHNGAQVTPLGVDVAPIDTFEVRVSNPTARLPTTVRSFFVGVNLMGAPAQFGYGKPPAAGGGSHFGSAIDTYERYVLVGMPDEGNGRAVLYSRFGRTWTEVAVFDAPAPGGRFGASVSIGKDNLAGKLLAVVGAPGLNTAYRFRLEGTQWEMAQLPATAFAGEFGAAVAIEKLTNGRSILVGSPRETVGGEPEAGNVRAYDMATFAPVPLQLPAPIANARFGSAIAMSSDARFAIGSPGERSSGDGTSPAYEEAGAAYVYQNANATPVRHTAPTPGAWDHFGAAIAITPAVVAIGAPLEDSGSATDPSDNSKDGAGAVYVFGPSLPAQGLYIKSPNVDIGDGFGGSLALRADNGHTLLAIGAPYEDSGMVGVDKMLTDETQPDAGAAYLYTLQNATLTFKHYLKASNASGGDLLGAAVAFAVDALFVTAPYEDSAATGWNGGQGDGDVDGDNGAVYTFR